MVRSGLRGCPAYWVHPRDVAVDDDQRWSLRLLFESVEGPCEHIQIVCVALPRQVPTIGNEPLGDVLGERPLRVAFDCDLVVVVDPAQVVKL